MHPKMNVKIVKIYLELKKKNSNIVNKLILYKKNHLKQKKVCNWQAF